MTWLFQKVRLRREQAMARIRREDEAKKQKMMQVAEVGGELSHYEYLERARANEEKFLEKQRKWDMFQGFEEGGGESSSGGGSSHAAHNDRSSLNLSENNSSTPTSAAENVPPPEELESAKSRYLGETGDALASRVDQASEALAAAHRKIAPSEFSGSGMVLSSFSRDLLASGVAGMNCVELSEESGGSIKWTTSSFAGSSSADSKYEEEYINAAPPPSDNTSNNSKTTLEETSSNRLTNYSCAESSSTATTGPSAVRSELDELD